jgi:peptidoglycan/LPS O-acetylase OafA/YrhL
LRRFAPLVAASAGVLTVLSLSSGASVRYRWSATCVAIAFAALMVWRVGTGSRRERTRHSISRVIAENAYSVYLTHVLCLHVASVIALRLANVHANWVYFMFAPVLCAALGHAFFRSIEAPSLLLRERLAPRDQTRARASADKAWR